MGIRMVANVLVSPMKTLQAVAEERPVPLAAGAMVVSSVSWSFGLKLAHDNGAGMVAEFISCYSAPHALIVGTVFQMNYIFLLVLFPLIALLGWFFRAAVLQLSAEILGGMGRGFSLLATSGLAHAPLILMLPIALLAMMVGGGNLGSGVGAGVWYTLALAIHFWTAYALLLSICATHQMKLLDAVRVVAYPVAAGLCVVLLMKILLWMCGVSFSRLVDLAQGG